MFYQGFTRTVSITQKVLTIFLMNFWQGVRCVTSKNWLDDVGSDSADVALG